MAKSEQDLAEIFEAGGNLPGGYVYDAGADPKVRKKTAAEIKADQDAVDAEAAAAKRRADIIERSKAVIANDPAPTV